MPKRTSYRRAPYGSTSEERFWFHVDKNGPTASHMTTPCWLWTASTCSDGKYGKFGLTPKRIVLAHRYSFELASGSTVLQIDHRCHMSLCVRPDHLRPATNGQNQENQRGANYTNGTGIRGVTRSGKQWRARVRNIDVGRYTTIEAAEAAVIAKRLELFTHNELDRVTASESTPATHGALG